MKNSRRVIRPSFLNKKMSRRQPVRKSRRKTSKKHSFKKLIKNKSRKRSSKSNRKKNDGTKKCSQCSNLQPDDTEFCKRCLESGIPVEMETMTEEEELSYATDLSQQEKKRKGDSEGILSYLTSFFLPSTPTVHTKLSSAPKSIFNINYNVDIQKNNLREYWSRGDGFCALHSLMQSYLINGFSFLLNNAGNEIKNIQSLRTYLLNEVIPDRSKIYKEHFKKTVSIPELIPQLKDDKTNIIVSEFVHQLMSDLFNSRITVYNLDKETESVEKIIYYPHPHIFGGSEAKGEIFVITNGGHYNSLIPNNTDFDTKKDALEWKLNMMKEGNGKPFDEKFIEERLANPWLL